MGEITRENWLFLMDFPVQGVTLGYHQKKNLDMPHPLIQGMSYSNEVMTLSACSRDSGPGLT